MGVTLLGGQGPGAAFAVGFLYSEFVYSGFVYSEFLYSGFVYSGFVYLCIMSSSGVRANK